MGDETTPEQPAPPKDELGDAGKRAIAAEREARKKAEQAVSELNAELQQLKDKDKSDSEKLADRLAAAERRAAEAESTAARMEVAAAKGLSAAQARRLVGTTREELEADADELLSSFRPQGQDNTSGDRPPTPATRPTAPVSGGSDPTQAPEPSLSDLREMVAKIPRT